MESDVYIPHLVMFLAIALYNYFLILFSWLIKGALYTKDKTKICSGFLINEYFLITAAHCITPDLSYVALGLSDTAYQHFETYSIKVI